MQEVLEKFDALMRLVADTKDRTNDLTLHLSVDEHDILDVVDDVADLLTYFPDLGPQLVHDFFKDFLVPESVNLA